MFLKRLLKLQVRKRKRHNAREGVYVVYGQSVSKRQISDISMGGLSFYYVDRGRMIDRGVRELSLVNQNRILLKGLAFERVSDVTTGEVMFRNKKVKRQSVRFGPLSDQQRQQLKAFISRFSE